MPDCRLLSPPEDDGPRNMAADEVLLAAAAAGAASFRLYGWTAPTLSLGYFQPAGPARAVPRLAGLPWVRRASGGAALVHHHEVTYALALPAGPPWQPRGTSWLGRMHRVLREALSEWGIATRLCRPGEECRRGEVLCFLHHTPDDLLLGNAKVAGSAQRRLRGALLQHGGLLLAGSPATPELPGIAELAGRRLASDEVGRAVVASLARATGWRLVPGDWTPQERQRQAELAAGKYGRPGWNARR
jgi:lipoate-protein ligase A